LFTIGAGGVGLTMTAADTIVFLQRDWSLIRNLQAEDRVHRIGSEIHEAIHIIDVVAPDTVEEWQIQRVHEKLKRLEEIRRDGLDLSTTIGDDIRHD
jgi:SNF2 family DNA or RNA helicase